MDTSSQSATTLASWFQPVWITLQELGIDPLPVFCDAGIDPKSINEPLSRIQQTCAYQLWAGLLKTTQDPAIALKVAKRITPATFYAVGISAMASRNVHDLLQRIMKYSDFLAQGVTFECCRVDDNLYRLKLIHENKNFHPVSDETLFAAFFYVAKQYLHWQLPGVKVCFAHEDRGVLNEFEGYFDCAVAFGERENAIYFNRAEIKRFPMTNPALASANDLIVEQQISRFESEQKHTVSTRIRAYIDKHFGLDGVSSKKAADFLHMSERNMQNQLQQQGTSYQKILDQWRTQKAKEWLLDKKSVSEIAWELGFNEVSSFSRAFKRWTGYSPSTFLQSGNTA